MTKRDRIETLEELHTAVVEHRAVVVPGMWVWGRARPAAFIIHQPGVVLLRMFTAGMYLYDKPGKEAQ